MVAGPGYFNLETLWFVLLAVLWVGFFVLEGFDFGIGMVYPVLGRDDPERHALLATILPIWDSYEVWLIVAAGAMFAAFPGWYAGLFSGYYIPLFLILLALIVRGVAIEYRNKHDTRRWRRSWDIAMPISCFAASFLFGVLFAGMPYGQPMTPQGDIVGSLADRFTGYAVVGGLTFVALFALHGTLFLTQRTRDDLERRCHRAALLLWPGAAAFVTGFLVWTTLQAASAAPERIAALVLAGLAVAGTVASGPLAWRYRTALAFTATSVAVVSLVGTLLVWLFPRVIASNTPGVASPTIFSTASGTYTLVAMTIVGFVFLPIVIAYQVWALRVFRARLHRDDFAHPPSVADLIRRGPLGRGEERGGGSDGSGGTAGAGPRKSE